MKEKLYKMFIIAAGFMVLNEKSAAQVSTDTIWIGSMLNYPKTYFTNYYQYGQLGLNSAFQRCIVPECLGGNHDSLRMFDNIIAGNDSVPETIHNPSNSFNIDWIYYFTNALYSKWEAEGDSVFREDEPVGIKHNGIGVERDNGKAWGSGNDPANIGKYFITGPNYTQYIRYVYTNKLLDNPRIRYRAVFRMKLGEPIEGGFDVAKIEAALKNHNSNTVIDLNSMILTTDSLSTEYKDFILEYDLSYIDPGGLESGGNQPLPPGWGWAPFRENEKADTSFMNFNWQIQFNVKWLGHTEVIVDYIEVYDRRIWEKYFEDEVMYDTLVARIMNYDQKLASLGAKLKYYHTIDEPHSFDCYIPIRKVQEILDSLQINRDLITHFYPGWTDWRDGVSIMDKWKKLANPKRINFWYAPFTIDSNGDGDDKRD